MLRVGPLLSLEDAIESGYAQMTCPNEVVRFQS
jgi:hypothetical protein